MQRSEFGSAFTHLSLTQSRVNTPQGTPPVYPLMAMMVMVAVMVSVLTTSAQRSTVSQVLCVDLLTFTHTIPN